MVLIIPSKMKSQMEKAILSVQSLNYLLPSAFDIRN